MTGKNSKSVSKLIRHSLSLIIILSIIISIGALANAGLFLNNMTSLSENQYSGQTPLNFSFFYKIQNIGQSKILGELMAADINPLAISAYQKSAVYKNGLVFMVALVAGASLFFLILIFYFFRNLKNQIRKKFLERAEKIAAKQADIIQFTFDKASAPVQNIIAKQEVDDVLGIVNNVRSLMDEMAVTVEKIGNSKEDSDKLVMVADKITFETNLLALKAEIKAEKSDDKDYMFSIVADEVRRLASSAADLTKDINILIKTQTKIMRNHAVANRIA